MLGGLLPAAGAAAAAAVSSLSACIISVQGYKLWECSSEGQRERTFYRRMVGNVNQMEKLCSLHPFFSTDAVRTNELKKASMNRREAASHSPGKEGCFHITCY
jgi:hypothetical protein